MKECTNCERLKQRVAELNSELLVLKIAAFAKKDTARTSGAGKPRTTSGRNQGDQPRAS